MLRYFKNRKQVKMNKLIDEVVKQVETKMEFLYDDTRSRISGLMEDIDIDYDAVCDGMDYGEIAHHIDGGEVAEYVEVDLYELAQNFNYEDIAEQIDTNEIANHLDVDEIIDGLDISFLQENISGKVFNDAFKLMLDETINSLRIIREVKK